MKENFAENLKMKNETENQQTQQDLKWSQIPNEIKKESALYSAEELMDLYKNGETCESQKNWIRTLMLAKYEQYIYKLIHTSFENFCPKYVCELFQEGSIGLIKAMNANYNKKFSFTTYCKGYINHELSNFAAHLMHGQTSHYAMIYKKVLRAQNELVSMGIDPTSNLIHILTDIPQASVEKALEVQHRTNFIYIDGLEEPDKLSEALETPEKIFDKKERLQEIHSAINALGSRRSLIVKMRFGITTNSEDEQIVPDQGMKVSEIARKLNLSARQVRAEYKAALETLKFCDYFSEIRQRSEEKAKRILNAIDTEQPGHEFIQNEMLATMIDINSSDSDECHISQSMFAY